MKVIKNLFITFLLLPFAGCGEIELVDESIFEDSGRGDSQYGEIIEIATQEIELMYPSKTREDIHFAKAEMVKAFEKEGGEAQNDTLFYVVNFENENGFVILSAREKDYPIIAVVPKGNYDPADITNNPGFDFFIDAVKDSLSTVSPNVITPTEDDYPMTADGKYVKTEKKVIKTDYYVKLDYEFTWGQQGIYGKFCPNRIVGCVPLAVACNLIFYNAYEEASGYIEYTYENADVESEVLDWVSMYLHLNSSLCNNNMTCEEGVKDNIHNQIARFCRQVGYDCNADYSNNYGTSVSFTDDAIRTLQKYLPTGHTAKEMGMYSNGYTVDTFHKGMYILFGEADHSYRHAWICDGAHTETVEYKEYHALPPPEGAPYLWEFYRKYTKDFTKNYMHWGADGTYDGWYNPNYIVTDSYYGQFRNIKSVYVGL